MILGADITKPNIVKDELLSLLRGKSDLYNQVMSTTKLDPGALGAPVLLVCLGALSSHYLLLILSLPLSLLLPL